MLKRFHQSARRTGPRTLPLTEPLEGRTLLSYDPVADFWPGREFDPGGLLTFGDRVWFAGTTPNGRNVYATDGTPAGTLDLAGPGSANFWQYGGPVLAGDRLYFQGQVASTYYIGTSRGTPATTTRLSVPSGGWNNNTETNTWGAALGNRLVFIGAPSQTSRVLYVTDGTDAGTDPLTTGLPAPHSVVATVLGGHNGLVWFTDITTQGLYRLGVTDGTAAGTRIIGDLNTGAGNLRPEYFTPLGDQVFFQVETGQGLKLWKSDGTAGGTGPVDTTAVAVPGRMAELGGWLYFLASPVRFKAPQLFRTDGTRNGTTLVATVNHFGGRANLTRAGEYLWFDNGENWRRSDNLGGVWRTDGTAAGTVQVAREFTGGAFAHFGDRLWLNQSLSALIDLDEPGEVRLTGLPPIVHDPIYRGTFTLAELGGHVYFPYNRALYRTAVPTTYLANVDVSAFYDADGDGVRDAGEGSNGIATPGTFITPYVFADLNGNGIHDGQAPLSEPYSPLGPDGTARLHGLPEGQVAIRLAGANWRFTTPHPVTVNVVNGQDPAPVAFGVNRNNRVSGLVYDDANGNHTQDPGEPPLAGRRVFLDADNDWRYDAGELFTLTGPDGRFFWETLPGSGFVLADAPDGWRNTEGAGGNYHSNSTDPRDLVYGPFGQTTLPAPGTVVANVFFADDDGDGTRGITEPLFAGPIRGFLDADNDGALDAGERAQPMSSGRVEIFNVPPGQYPFRFIPPPGWAVSTPVPVAEVRSGETTVVPPVGLRPSGEPGSVAGVFFQDDDFDGVRDAGEPPARDVLVFLDLTGNGRTDDDPLTVTDYFGGYRFPGLAAGTYVVGAMSQLAGYSAVLPREPQSRTVAFDGTTPATADFAVALSGRAARLTGRVYHDVNGNNVFDAGDVPVPNVAVSSPSGTQGPGIQGIVALTGPDGRYDLPVAAGTRTILVATPAGWSGPAQSSAQALAVGLQTSNGPDFRLTPATPGTSPAPAAIVGNIFHDVDADGVRDTFEPPLRFTNGPLGLPYLDLDGDGTADAGEPTAQPDDRGDFTFGGLAAGTYAVRLNAQNGHVQTFPASAPHTVSVAAGGRSAPVVFGWVFRPASISGDVYLDANANGRRDDGEGPVQGVIVRVDVDGNGSFTDPVDRTAGTGANGRFTVGGLSPGRYFVAVRNDVFYQQTGPDGGAPVQADVGIGQAVTVPDIGVVRTAGILEGTLYLDDDRDGVHDPNEQTFEGWTVTVQDTANAARSWTARTDRTGRWRVAGVPAGNYRVTLTMASENFEFVTPAGPAFAHVVNLAAGQDAAGLDFGIGIKPVRFHGEVFDDADGDAGRDPGEGPRAGVTVFIDSNDNRTLDEGERTVVSGADGRFDFGFVQFDQSRWVFRAIRPPQSLPTVPQEGNYDYLSAISVTPGTSVNVGAFGFLTPTSKFISGFAFRDTNANGVRDPGEPPLAGRLIAFDGDTEGDPIGYTRTGPDGWYAFRLYDRRDGYFVRELLPSNEVGTLPRNGGWHVIHYAPGEAYPNVDFGSLPWPETGRSAVFARHVMYSGGASGAAPAAVSTAIAEDKRALLPGERATFANVANFARGISGVAVDLAGLDPLAVLTADDFDLAVSRSAAGPCAPAGLTPLVQVLRGQGFGGSDRVVLTFPDNAVRDTWLRVTVRASARTRLTAPETFYYGHLTGETGDSAAGGALTVTAIDMLRTRRAVGGTYDTRYDFNRDGRVSPVDLAIVRAAQRRSLGLLNAPAPPAPTPPPPSASAGDAGENRDEEQGLLA